MKFKRKVIITKQFNIKLFKMRTKHIFYSIALGAAFVACSSEENFSVNSNDATDAKLSIRPVFDAEIVLGGDEALTRFSLGTGARPEWSENDKLGAAIIDVPTYTSEADYATKIKGGSKPIALYKVVNSYGCNNAFTTADGGKTWSAEHPMVEGNYLFYAPYQVNLGYRTPLATAVPAIQNATKEKQALEDFYDGSHIVQVGYQFLAKSADGTQKPSVSMYNIFAYPEFTIKNNFDGYLFDETAASAVPAKAFSGEMVVDSIQFLNVGTSKATKSSALAVGGQLQHIQAEGAATSAAAGVIFQLKEKANGFDADGSWNDLDKALKSQTKDLLGSTNQVMNNRQGQADVITTAVINQTIAKGGEYKFYLVMPGYKFNFTDDQLMAKVFFTVDGIQYVINDAKFSKLTDTATETKLEDATSSAGTLFDAKANKGLSNLTLMPGQRVPSEAIRVVKNSEGKPSYALKADVKDLLTIELVGGKASTAGIENVQIGVRKGAANDGITDNTGLIDKIVGAANGTAWAEGADGAGTKGYTIAANNSVVINSELIDALATNNQNTGGSFKIKTVVPISTDVEITAYAGNKLTIKSNSGKEYQIELDAENVVTTATTAAGKYAIIGSAVPTAFNEKTTAIVTDNASVTLTKDTKINTLHILSDKTLTLAGEFKLTVSNLRNNSGMSVVNEVEADILNNGTITIADAKAKVKVAAGEGEVVVGEAITGVTGNGITIATAAKQDVVYAATTTVGTTQITAAAAIKNINLIRANGATTIKKADIAKFGAIRRIEITADGLTTDEAETYNLSGFTIIANSAATWTGKTAAQTKVTGVVVEANANVTLENIAVNGTKTGSGKVLANGDSATWNDGKSE